MIRSAFAVALTFALLGATPGVAHAETAAGGERTKEDHRVSVTLSPLHLLNPEAHLTGEGRLTRKMSVAVMGGAGKVTSEGTSSFIWEAGGQFRFYPLGSFAHGLMVGADAGYTYVNPELENPVAYLAGVHAGGFLGYKYSMDVGFTTECQIGPVYLWGRSDKTTEWQTLLALKVGWSF
ncbi:MAG: hypothetical protein FJ104_04345 [Deltaproteobacteria bacterium]|nr:hypothetical protein [Deltaproteobacteria bacterium]